MLIKKNNKRKESFILLVQWVQVSNLDEAFGIDMWFGEPLAYD